jgi:alpha-mannosidase
VVVDVPPFGFVWLAPGKVAAKTKRPPKPLAEDGLLRNEYFEALINTTTGALQSIHEYDSRKNRLSQQLGFRISAGKRRAGNEGIDPDERAEYSVMAADSIETTVATEVMGEIVARGRLLDYDGGVLAGFRQTYRLWRGSRVLWLEIELDPKREPAADPWESYYASRFAWADESAELSRALNQTRQAIAGKRWEAPQYIDIDSGETRTTILTGGLPFHRRIGFRMIDSLLIVRGERQRRHTMGIGIDLSHPQHDAEAMLAPPLFVQSRSPGPGPAGSGWLLRLDAKNVIATTLEPIADGGAAIGFRARLLETAGRPANLKVSCFRPIAQALRLDLQGQAAGDVEVQDGSVLLDMTAHEWTEIEALFVRLSRDRERG